MLPPVPDVATWRILRRDAVTQRPAFDAIAGRHGLAANELCHLDKGTHFVWATRRSVIKLFVPLWAEDASLETTMLDVVAGTTLPAPQLEAQGDLTDDNVLVSGDRVTGIIDFADAFVGPWTYELAAPACFVTRGSSAHRDSMFRGRGFEPTPELIATTRAWAILHRYSHLARMMRRAGVATLPAFLELI